MIEVIWNLACVAVIAALVVDATYGLHLLYTTTRTWMRERREDS